MEYQSVKNQMTYFNLSFSDRFSLPIIDNQNPNQMYHDQDLKKIQTISKNTSTTFGRNLQDQPKEAKKFTFKKKTDAFNPDIKNKGLSFNQMMAQRVSENIPIQENNDDGEEDNIELKKQKSQILDYTRLKKISLGFVFEHFFADFKNMSHDGLLFECEVKNNQFKINGQKWYNETLRMGHVDAIELTKHLICIFENISIKNLQNNDINKDVFKKAIHELEKILPLYEKFLEENIKKSEDTVAEKNQEKSLVSDGKFENNKKQIDWKKIYQDMNNIPVSEVAEILGGNANEDGISGKWKMYDTGHNVQINGQLWKDFNEDFGSGGAISFMMHHLKLTQNIFVQNDEDTKKLRSAALHKLISLFGTEHKFELKDHQFTAKEPFYMPEIISQKLYKVVEYLHEKRGIPHWIIQKQIDAEYLFAGFPSDWNNRPNLDENLDNDYVWAVFLSPTASAAEMRGVTRKDSLAKILAKGSDKELGGFTVKAEKEINERIIVACEAAIDSLSYHTLFPGRSAISCMGVNFNLACEIAQDTLSMSTKNGERYKFKLCFDNDLAGNEATVSFMEKMIAEIGEEEYLKEYQSGHIEYFELGLQALVSAIREHETFYFEAMNTEKGKKSVDLFRDAFKKKFGAEKEKKLLDEGKLKYINISPNFYTLNANNIDKEVENTLQLLSTKAPYYLYIKQKADDKLFIKENIKNFQDKLKGKLGVKYEQFITDGKIILQTPRVFKDWNECILYKMKNPKFIEYLNQMEERFKKKSFNQPTLVK